MATIAQNITKIRSAVYGSEVRTAIADAIQQCYDAVNNTNNSAISNLSSTINSNYNTLNQKIITETQNRSSADATFQSNLTALTQRLNTLSAMVGSIHSFTAADLNGVNSRLTTLENRVDGLASQGTDISTLKTTTAGLRTSLQQLQSTVNGIHSFSSADLAGVSQQIAGIISNVSAIQTQYSAHQIDATGMRGELDQLQTDLAALRAVVEGLTALSGTAEEIEELQDQLQIVLAGINDRITALSAKHDTELAALHQEIAGEMNQVVNDDLERDRQLRYDHEVDMRNVRREVSRIDSYAVAVATRHENDMANMQADIDSVMDGIAEVKEIQDGLVHDILKDGDAFYGINTKGDRITEYITGIGGSGSGGGGGSQGGTKVETKIAMSAVTLSPENGQVRKGDPLMVSFSWSSLLDNQPTGKGSIIVYVKNVRKALLKNKSQGNVEIDISPYLDSGTSTVRVEVVDSYENATYRRFDVDCVDLNLTSSFDSSTTFSGPIQFRLTPHSDGEKTIHVKLDSLELDPLVTSSKREVTYTIPAQNQGSHTLEAWYSVLLNGETLESNHLYYEFISLEIGDDTVVIASDFNTTEMEQYDSAAITWKVYDPASQTVTVSFYENDILKYSGEFDRNVHTYVFHATNAGETTVKLVCQDQEKEWTITVTPSSMDIHAETDGLELYLTPVGRSNGEQNPASWGYNDVPVTLTGIDWDTDGWHTDEENNTSLRLRRGGRAVVGFKPFQEDIRSSGMLIEIEFAIRNVENFDTTAISCYSGGRGFFIKPNLAEFHSENATLRLDLMEDLHTRLTFAIDKRADGRMMMAYIDGIPQQAVRYPDVDDFSQVDSVNITFGSDQCDVDIYCVRIYNHSLIPQQILSNFIADTQNGQQKRDRYIRNDIYDDYGHIDPEKLPFDLPYMFIESTALPSAKTDSGIPCEIEYVDQQNPAKSFTATGVKSNAQGTSSLQYPVKNIDLQFKKGFDTLAGHTAEYALVDSILPFNRFVLKADYASSEGANNVEFVKLFNDLNPYKKRERIANPMVRDGIYGVPIVCFHRDPETKEIQFVGKYNFNLPKRAPGPYGYSGNQESWEFENNSPGLMWFTSDVFDETLVLDDTTGEEVPKWTKDFEARFPSSDWMDYSKIKELETFVVSTNRDAATGENLEAPVVYDGVSYSQDTAEYRLAKFKNEFPSYGQLDSFIYYYTIGEWALDMDGWGKNLFIGFVGDDVTAEDRVADRKAICEPYDKDTIWGINNEGALVFVYWVENTDIVNGKRPHTSYGSVLWNNIRDAFSSKISQMFGNLRENGLSYENVEGRMEEHQNHWPEAIWIEDTWYKYVNQPTTEHWQKLQGDKRHQRRMFMSKRTKYLDSKWIAGNARTDTIQLRGYARSDITLVHRMKLYSTISWGSAYTTKERVEAGASYTHVCPLSDMNDTEIYIRLAGEISSCGDLSGLYTGEAIFSAAKNLLDIQLGSSDVSYSNLNLHRFEAGSEVHPMPLLKTVDIRGCTGLGLADEQTGYIQETIDMRYADNLQSFLAERTNIKGIQLARGTRIQHLHLPNTITGLVLLDAKKLTDLVAPIGVDFSTLWLENCPNQDTKTMLMAVPSATRVRLIGVNWTCNTGAEIVALYEQIRLMRGLDENGDAPTPNIAQISGVINIDTLTVEENTAIEAISYRSEYPYLTIHATHTSAVLTYKNWDGSETLYTETIVDGADGTYDGQPSRNDSEHWKYTFIGWSTSPGNADAPNSADANALTAVTTNRTVYAAYSGVSRAVLTYKSWDGSQTITEQVIYDGGNGSYSGQPAREQSAKYTYTFTGWGTTAGSGVEPNNNPSAAATQNVSSDRTVYACYSGTIRQYTILFVKKSEDNSNNGDVTLQTTTYNYGQTPSFTGTTPTTSKGDATSYPFLGWTPAIAQVTGAQTYYATFGAPKEIKEITDSWDTVFAALDDGSYANKYKVGNYKTIDLGTEGSGNVSIVALDADECANGSGMAPISCVVGFALNTSKRMTPKYASHTEGTGTLGGWDKTEMKQYILNTIMPLIPAEIRSRIVPVKKYTKIYQASDETAVNNVETTETVYLLSDHEVFKSRSETMGPDYTVFFSDTASRKMYKTGGTSSIGYWLRSANSLESFCRVDAIGVPSSGSTFGQDAVVIGFCLGSYPKIHAKSGGLSALRASMQAGTYATDYAPGDLIPIDNDGENSANYVQILGFDADDKADNSGKAKISAAYYYALPNTRRMNPIKVNNTEGTGTLGGWDKSEMKTYLTGTLWNNMDSTLKSMIVPVKKYTRIYQASDEMVVNDVETTETVYLLSNRELGGSVETVGPKYSSAFPDNTSRKRKRITDTSYWYYWERSANNSYIFSQVDSDGSMGYSAPYYNAGKSYLVLVGFCLDIPST